MTHATGHDGDEETPKPQTDVEKGAALTKEALANPEVQGKVKMVLVEGGLALKKRAETPGTRQALAKKLLDAMTAEEQTKFIENTHTWTHNAKEFMLDRLTVGIRPLWKLAAPSILPEEWATIESFKEEEIKGYIALGAMDVEESVAKLVDTDLKDKAKMLKVIGWLCNLIPEIGVELAEIIGTIAHLAEAPAAFLEKVLPEVREAVRNGGIVGETITAERGEINATVPPSLKLINTPPETKAPKPVVGPSTAAAIKKAA